MFGDIIHAGNEQCGIGLHCGEQVKKNCSAEKERVNQTMQSYTINEAEKEFLKNYDITRYDRPSVAADIAIFSVMARAGLTGREQVQDKENYRKMPEQKLKILLIRRASYPYKDCFSLPGGFCRKNEDIYETARRELYEETYVENAYLNPCGIFGESGRDPRGWVISHAFLALIDGDQCRIKAGSDAWEARWFDVTFSGEEIKKEVKEDDAFLEHKYVLTLESSDIFATNLPDRREGEAIVLSAVIKEQKEFKNYHETLRYEVLENDGFAFDHAKIITCALLSLRRQAQMGGPIVFDLMSKRFTLAQLQNAYEIILGRKLLTANFRRKMADFVVETDEMITGAGHRPAKLFQRNIEAFYR